MRPPALAFWCGRYRRPASFVLHFGVGKKLVCGSMQKDAIITSPVRLEDPFEFGPNRVVTALIFDLAAGINCHDK